ncbi:MAG: prephenate dehydrogenase/arogenate dehydrogenase family protein [Pseudomonadota bacterium]
MIKRLAVIGVGLIGGSYARALRAAGQVEEIIGCGRSRENLERALELGVIDSYSHDIGEAVEGADLVFLAVPLGAIRPAFAAMQGHLADDAIITDAGSVKGSVIRDCEAVFGSMLPNFVPGHPIAGAEQNGVEASSAGLYHNRRVILTPVCQTNESAIAVVQAAWRYCGAEVTRMFAVDHDRILAATSHLPHMLAYALVDMLARMDDREEVFRYAAGGFRDFTRIASSHPVMWRDICVANKEQLAVLVEDFAAELHQLAASIRAGEHRQLEQIFENAKNTRDSFIDGVKPSASPE